MKPGFYSLAAALLSSVSAVALGSAAHAQQTPTPTSSPIIGIAPVHSSTAEASHILKAAPGNLYDITASNGTATPGFLILVDTPTVPATGSLTGTAVVDCLALPASGNVHFTFTPPHVYTSGITALLSSASSCFTFTNGTITGFISGLPK